MWGWGESIENSRQCMPPSPSSSSSTKISLMGHADLPDSFAKNRCFIYALCYSHLLHASFEEAQGFWLKKDLQLLNTMFISDTLKQCSHLNLKLPLCFVCSGATDWQVFTRYRRQHSFRELMQGRAIPAPPCSSWMMLKGDHFKVSSLMSYREAARFWRPQPSLYLSIATTSKKPDVFSVKVRCYKVMITARLEGTLSILPSDEF